MRFQINFKSGKPVYLQLVDQIKMSAAAGAIRTDDPLPSIRQLAEDLRVNRNTVAKAYSDLEGQGVIESLPGKGSFIRAAASPFKKEVRLRLLAQGLDEVVVQAHHLQLNRADFLKLAEERYDVFSQRRDRAANE